MGEGIMHPCTCRLLAEIFGHIHGLNHGTHCQIVFPRFRTKLAREYGYANKACHSYTWSSMLK
jgi:hypothetical protein